MDTSMSTGLIAMHWYPKETIKNNQYKREKNYAPPLMEGR